MTFNNEKTEAVKQAEREILKQNVKHLATAM